jgi:hypothetical protein
MVYPKLRVTLCISVVFFLNLHNFRRLKVNADALTFRLPLWYFEVNIPGQVNADGAWRPCVLYVNREFKN